MTSMVVDTRPTIWLTALVLRTSFPEPAAPR
jgi:hypothetical protein